jgi:hypothetical protein
MASTSTTSSSYTAFDLRRMYSDACREIAKEHGRRTPQGIVSAGPWFVRVSNHGAQLVVPYLVRNLAVADSAAEGAWREVHHTTAL